MEPTNNIPTVLVWAPTSPPITYRSADCISNVCEILNLRILTDGFPSPPSSNGSSPALTPRSLKAITSLAPPNDEGSEFVNLDLLHLLFSDYTTAILNPQGVVRVWDCRHLKT